MMEFSFICPEQGQTFKSADFKIIDHRGIATDSSGNRVLDAKVELNEACPFCGRMHTYHASELACPFRVSKAGGQLEKRDDKT